MTEGLLDFKKDLHFDIEIDSEFEQRFPEESFFDVCANRLGEAGILDDAEQTLHKDSRKGERIDGYSWNNLERTFCVVIGSLSSSTDELEKLNKTAFDALIQKARRFLERVLSKGLSGLDPSSPGYIAGSSLLSRREEILKFRIVLITDFVFSNRIDFSVVDEIDGKPVNVEAWDLERLYSLHLSESDSEPFTIGPDFLKAGLPVIKGASLPDGSISYLGVMPARLLSNIYESFGQRLLEGNVRTFLDFRSGVNKGLRRTLVLEPDHFFAYNNGITVTADEADIEVIGELVLVKSLTNMQIVNGGQTTAAIFFAPKELGGVKTAEGEKPFKGIDLDRVSVQMKLTVFHGEARETADVYRSNISNYANSQNSVQNSDLVSNHPLHLKIEHLSRQLIMPSISGGVSTKWFYERTRGQYTTQMRALSSAARRKFVLEYPKNQLFTKTDMAKYENTWRMRPHIVKKGAQANLKLLGPELVREFEENPENFEAGFYKDLISKAILFRTLDKQILQTDWYKQEGGLKAEAVTFGIALVRYKLVEHQKDLNLQRIFDNQGLSTRLLNKLLESAKIVRTSITNSIFRGGTGNPSEFCKSESGWNKVKELPLSVDDLDHTDILNADEAVEVKKEKKAVNTVSSEVADFEMVCTLSSKFWTELARFNANYYGPSEIQVSVPSRCAAMLNGGRAISPKQAKAALRIKSEAEARGFEFG